MTFKNAVDNTQFTCSETCSKERGTTNRIKYSDSVIKHLKQRPKRTDYYIIGYPGFGIRISPKGRKSWIFTYTYDGKGQVINYGHYPKVPLFEAREKYLIDKAKIDNGVNPKPPKEAPNNVLTLRELIDRYVTASKASGKKSWKEELCVFEKHLIPKLGQKKIHLITDEDLMPIFNHIRFKRKANSTATHLYAYTRRLFNFAADERFYKMSRRHNPCLEIKLGIKNIPRNRHLHPEEIHVFWHNLEKIRATPLMKLTFKFILCTAVRSIEIRQFKWAHLGSGFDVWKLPKTKNGTFHRIHLGTLAQQILQEAKAISDASPFVFGFANKRSGEIETEECFTKGAMGRAIYANRDIIDIEERFTPHDLRRTSATLIAAMFGDRNYVKRALNHVENDATSVYDQYIYDREKRISSNVLDYVLRRIIESKDIQSIPTLDVLREEIEANGLLEGKPRPQETEAISISMNQTGISYSVNMNSLKIAS